MAIETHARMPPTQQQRKRKRPLPQSDSSKTTTHTCMCPISQPSISSSMTTTSLSGNKKRPRSTSLGVDALEEDGKKEIQPSLKEGEGMIVVAMEDDAGVSPKQLGPPIKMRSEMVRRIERLIMTMFKELDVLLRAEGINRRVMYRWSGADRKMAIGEGNASYCTWGRELIKQYIEDAVDDVRSTMTTGDYNDISSSIEAARRLTFQYLTNASERSIMENERSLHNEVMNTLGNLWFALLPHMILAQRQQFRRLVARIRKMGGGAGGGAGGNGLVVPFRCALGFAKLDLSPEALATHGMAAIQLQLERLLKSDIYECDAYLCLWKVSEALAGLAGFAHLCQEFRLKSLDAEMWRSMLLEEQEQRQQANGIDDYDDEDVIDDSSDDGEGEQQEEEVEHNKARMEEQQEQEDHGLGKEEDEEEEIPYAKVTGRGGADDNTMIALGANSPFSASAGLATTSVEDRQDCPLTTTDNQIHRGGPMAGWSTVGGTGCGTPLRRYASTPSHSQKNQNMASMGKPSAFSSERRSSEEGVEAVEGGNGVRGSGGEQQVPLGGNRWKTKAALEEGECEQYADFMSLHQYEYRRVMTPDFLQRLWTLLEACESLIDCEGSGMAGEGSLEDESGELSYARLLFVKARPFLYRLATLLPTEELSHFLDLVATKFTYTATIRLLEPLLIQEPQSFSTERITQILEWTVEYKKGTYLPVITRMLLPRLQSKTQLERLARRAIVYGLPSLPVVDRALARMPRPAYEAVALHLCQRAVEYWGVGRGVHLIVLRALQGMPSLGLYLKCRGCFLDPMTNLVKPLIHQLNPTGELSIGIRLVEGIVGSAVSSMVASLDVHRVGVPERRLRAQHWADFSFAGVRGGQFPPTLLDRLFTNETFLLAILGASSSSSSDNSTTVLDAVKNVLTKLHELAHHHPAAVSRSVRAVLCTYMGYHRTNTSLDLHVRKVAEDILQVVRAKGIAVEVMA